MILASVSVNLVQHTPPGMAEIGRIEAISEFYP
jgi:hypothetical protein